MELKRLRKERALSIRELSQVSGVATFTINQAERGLREPHPKTLRKLAKALNVEPIDILGGTLGPKAPAPAYPSHISDDDRRTLNALAGITRTLAHRLSTDTLDAETLELARQYHDGIAPTLARIMRQEADALRRMHPEAHDVSPWATAGPTVARYIEVSMRVLDAGDELDREHQEAYALVS